MQNKKNDTVIIYGSGNSLNSITDDTWCLLSKYDSIGFNMFVLQNWISPNFMVVGDIRPDKNYPKLLGAGVYETYDKYLQYANTERYKQSCFIVRKDQTSFFPDRFSDHLNCHFVEKTDIFGQKNIERIYTPRSALFSALDFALTLGYKRVVFAGVDLYDYRFFFLSGDNPRAPAPPVENPTVFADRKKNNKHPIHRKTFDGFNDFRQILKDTKLECINPESLILNIDYIDFFNG